MTFTDVTLALLAGGMGSRMGRPKSLLQLRGRPILSDALARFHWPGPTLLVTSPGREHPPGWAEFSAEAVDPVAGLGPLRGVLTALEAAATPVIVVTTVDMPGIDLVHLHWLVEEFDRRPQALGMMALRNCQDGERIEPFPSIYRGAARTIVADRLVDGARSVHSLLRLEGFAGIPSPASWDPRVWTNINWPEELRRWELEGEKENGSSC